MVSPRLPRYLSHLFVVISFQHLGKHLRSSAHPIPSSASHPYDIDIEYRGRRVLDSVSMMRYKVRFASQAEPQRKNMDIQSPVLSHRKHTTQQRSRFGCRECRQRKVKCDETFPVCQHCQRRGSLCQPSLRPSQWHIEVPWLANLPSDAKSLAPMVNVRIDSRLILYWLEATSRMLSVDPSNNPFSFPILKYVSGSASLIHFLQSASAGQEEYFYQPKMTVSLEERGKALFALRQELQTQGSSLSHCFFTLLMLGMSSSWMALSPTGTEYGRDHLVAARAVASMILKNTYSKTNELDHLAMGIYVYWDMACSFCLDPQDHSTDHENSVETYAKLTRTKFHPITTHSMDLYHILGQLGRYCRSIVDGCTRDLLSEINFERALEEYSSIETDCVTKSLTEAFRKHGLLLLYRFCGKPEVSEIEIHKLALDIIGSILKIESRSPCVNIQVIPILSAGAEMTSLDTSERNHIKQRLKEIYSTNRLLPTLWVLDLLEELWKLHDGGITYITWLELMLKKKWRLRVG